MTREKAAVLVVEDEEAICSGLCDALEFCGHAPAAASSGEEGLQRALTEKFALVLLDVMLPGMDGFAVCRALRSARPQQAILMLTARGAEEDVLEGFRSGADDYITKPFSVAELLARVEALLRRSGCAEPVAESFAFGAWRVEPEARHAVNGTVIVALTGREVALLALFVRERGRIVSRRRLLADVWGMRGAEDVQTRTVDMHIAKLRRKIAPDGELVETVRGEGYRFAG